MPGIQTMRLALVDDHKLFRKGLINLIEIVCSECDILFEADNGAGNNIGIISFKPLCNRRRTLSTQRRKSDRQKKQQDPPHTITAQNWLRLYWSHRTTVIS